MPHLLGAAISTVPMTYLRALAAGAAALLLYSLAEPYWLTVDELTVTDGRLPKAFEGKRIAFASDIHCGPFVSASRVGTLVERMNSLNPDIIVLGGDYTLGSSDNIEPCIAELARLKAPLGVYAVLGNHDTWAGTARTSKALESAGIRVLDNDAVWVASGGSRIRVGGVGDLWTASQDLGPTLEGLQANDFAVLLTHNPHYAEITDISPFALVLGGHTHGGQILPVRLLAPYLPERLRQRYVAGLYEEGHAKIAVTNGFGMVFFPVRFMSRPQIMVLSLRSGIPEGV
jgi:uncharacterized protein